MTSRRKMIVRSRLNIRHICMIVALLGHLSQAEAQVSQGGRPSPNR